MKEYTQINAKTIDSWNKNGWTWGVPITHEQFLQAQKGDWRVLLTPVKFVPENWFGQIRGKSILGLACGGGQQMPLFSAAGASCTVLDLSDSQLESERRVAEREGYGIDIVKADMTERLPFADGCFDLIFHPVSNCYVEEVEPIWRECFRVLKSGGRLMAGFDMPYIFSLGDDNEFEYRLPFNPLKDKGLFDMLHKNNDGVQFSHTLEENIGGQLKAGFRLVDIYQDCDGESKLNELNVPSFIATLAVK
ncbi:MAG: class I SAM-dependent methyltransferase [Clostridia bacterium]|nr:class I SAM-dependent methyltransferase [Clostridia bacterium]